MSETVLERESVTNRSGGGWMVTIFNNDTNTDLEVISVLIRSTGCDLQEAATEVWEAETYGKAPVHFDAKMRCEEIAQVISAIGVKTEVTPEWND